MEPPLMYWPRSHGKSYYIQMLNNVLNKEKNMSFKVGDEVIASLDTGPSWETTIAEISKDGRYKLTKWQHGGKGYCHWRIGEAGFSLIKKEKTMKKVEEAVGGDVLVNSWADYKRIVEAVVTVRNITFLITVDNDDDRVRAESVSDIESDGWTLEPEVKELTVEEISKALGYEVKVVK